VKNRSIREFICILAEGIRIDLNLTDHIIQIATLIQDDYPIKQMVVTIATLLLGPFTGVVLAFWVNNKKKENLEHKRQLFFKNLLLNEIKRSIQLLVGNHPNLIPVDAWNSLVNSGEITLFSRAHAILLSNVYFEIQNYNYEVNWIWQHNFVNLDIDLNSKTQDETITSFSAYLATFKKPLLEKLRSIEDELDKIK
jgi:hypothetical protein